MANTFKTKLVFHSETGTEGGWYAWQDIDFIGWVTPNYGVFGGDKVKNKDGMDGVVNKGSTTIIKPYGLELPYPDPMQRDPDYLASSLYRGEHGGNKAADNRLMEKYNFKIIYSNMWADETFGPNNWHFEDNDHLTIVSDVTQTKDGDEYPIGTRFMAGGTPRSEPNRPYGVSTDDVTRQTVTWSDGTQTECLSSDLLVERWDYQGLNYLQTGDYLKIFDKQEPEKVVWEGIITLRERDDVYTNPEATVFGMWINQEFENTGIDRQQMAKYFIESHPCEVTVNQIV